MVFYRALTFYIVFICFYPKLAALPAFSFRENAPCQLCHINGSAPQLTRYGFTYRRAGYRPPESIGNDDAEMKRLTEHLAVGLNVDYSYFSNEPAGNVEPIQSLNQFYVRSLELWPLVGGFQDKFAVFSKLDFTPSTDQADQTSLSQAELIYVSGSTDLFFHFRAGLLSPQGYGAHDQWIDPGNLPLFDKTAAQLNQDTLVTPVGPKLLANFGMEIGLSSHSQTYVSVGVLNGFDGTSGIATDPSGRTPAVRSSDKPNVKKDFKIQIDQFLGDSTAITSIYYDGTVPLFDPDAKGVWENEYNLWRIYITQTLREELILLSGFGQGKYEAKDEAIGKIDFISPGGFIGLTGYLPNKLTVSARYDYFEYGRYKNTANLARGGSIMFGIPLRTTLLTFHYNHTQSDLIGLVRDARVEWRLVF